MCFHATSKEGYDLYLSLNHETNMKDLDKHLMSSKESKILAEAYEQSNYATINKTRSPGKPDSRMYTIDLKILKDYLQLIDEEMEKCGILNKGVRVTLGKYPINSQDPKINADYLGYQTIFFSAVDLDEDSTKNNLVESDKKDCAAPEDIPNMNYMTVSPPW